MARTISHLVSLFLLAIFACGCAIRNDHDRGYVSAELEKKGGHPLPSIGKPGEVRIPPGVSLDRLTADDAVAVALWNNAAFQADLAALGFARAELLQAGLLRNPVYSVLFPLGPKQLEFTVMFPIEDLWQRPRRVASAKRNAEAVASRLVSGGLRLVAEAKSAHADLLLAQERTRRARALASVDEEIAQLAAARLRAGDISELEAVTARSHSLRSREEAARARADLAVSEERLRSLLGLGMTESRIALAESSPALPPALESRQLLADALAARPDARAAELEVEAAGKRAGWEKSKVFALALALDANSEGQEGFEAGPGLAGPLPVFDWNQGGIARARAEMERAAFHYVEVQQRIALEVREAHARFLQAREAAENWTGSVLPLAEERLRAAEKSLEAGETSYLFLLETKRELLDARGHDAELAADLRRALARLEQSVGRKL